MCIEVTRDILRYKTDEASISTSSCVPLLLWSSRGSVGLISSVTKIWAGSDAKPPGRMTIPVPFRLCSLRSTGHNTMLRQKPFTGYSGNVTKPPLDCRTELLEELQPSKKVQDSFAVDFRVRIVSVPSLGCKLDHFRGCKCVQSPKSHTRVNTAECSVFVGVTKIISVFLSFYYLS